MEKITAGTSKVKIDIKKNIVIKTITQTWSKATIEEVFINEVFWLKKSAIYKRIPTMESFDKKKNQIVTRYCGEPITRDNKPQDLKDQLEMILQVLSLIGCRHNDIKPENLLVRDGFISLIDFGWACPIDAKTPEHWPEVIGGIFKSSDDKKAMEKVYKWLK